MASCCHCSFLKGGGSLGWLQAIEAHSVTQGQWTGRSLGCHIAKMRLEGMRGKVQPERGLLDTTEGWQQGCWVCGSKAASYGESWDPRSTGSLATCQTFVGAANRQDIDPFISCVPVVPPWKLRLSQEMGGRQHPHCPSRGAAREPGGALLSAGARGSALSQAAA